MSTLTSSQMHVKRSSTRLHAPPGGHSSLSFGVGGFGTTDPEKAAASDPAEPPSTAGTFRANTSGGSYGSYNHPANNQSSDASYGASAPAFHAMKGSSSSMNPYGGAPPSSQGFNTSYGHAGTPSASFPGHASDPRPASTQSNYSWGERGSQPPLTSSKRDQNWEKKRRLWLARKNGGSQCPTPGTGMSFGPMGGQLPLPPMTAYGGGGGSNYYEHDPGAYNPPSPLTKFMAQQAHSQPFTQPTSGGYEPPPAMYGGAGRPPSASGGIPPRTAVGNPYRDDLPPSTAYSAGASSHGNRNLSSASGFAGHGGYGGYAAPPPSCGGAMYAPPRTSMPGTASSVSSATSSGRRQPPGGTSNWSPYS